MCSALRGTGNTPKRWGRGIVFEGWVQHKLLAIVQPVGCVATGIVSPMQIKGQGAGRTIVYLQATTRLLFPRTLVLPGE